MKRKTLIAKCNYPWGDFSPTHAINHYLGCAFNCPYCWARDVWWKRMGRNLTKIWGVPEDFEWRMALPFEVSRLDFLRELNRLPTDSRILLCSTTDPYQYIDEKVSMTRRLLLWLGAKEIQTIILTKSALRPERDFDVLKGMDAWFGITMEYPFSHSNWHYARMAMLHEAHRQGIKTFVSLEPWLPGVNAKDIVQDMASFTNHWIVGPLNYKGVDTNFYRENLPGLIELFERMGTSYFIKPDLMRYL